MKTHEYPHHALDIPHHAPDTPRLDQPRQAASDIAQQVTHTVKDAAQHATQAAKDLYQSAATRAEDTLVQSKQYVSANPMAVVFGAFTLGLTLGCMLGLSHHRQEPTIRERFRW
jgi:ElaB/YqjD/DUF883 family membrane-anchored ribosome-binding protein